MVLSKDDYKELLERFPSVTFAFAYGSGAIEQGGYKKDIYSESSALGGEAFLMLDVIFAVDDPVSWHLENKRRNPTHYTSFISD